MATTKVKFPTSGPSKVTFPKAYSNNPKPVKPLPDPVDPNNKGRTLKKGSFPGGA